MIQDDVKSTIKRVYDQYNPQDFTYGAPGSDNLNPQREMVLDQIDKVEKKIQEITNAVVLKKLKPKEPDPEVEELSVLPEASNGNNFQRQMKVMKTGSTDDNFFDLPEILTKQMEEMIGILPTEVSNLAKPPILQCKEILKQYSFEDKNYTVYEEDDVLPTYVHNDPDYKDEPPDVESEEDDPENENEDEEYSNQLADCAEIELEFLKVLLIILKILKVIKIIIDYVISLITVTIQIVCLAVGAWLNPPNIAQIVEILIEIVISIIMIILSKLLQLLWNLLNLDCMADQTMDLIDQIRDALSAFRSMMGFINPASVSVIGDKFKQAFDPLDTLEQMMTDKGDAWRKAMEDVGKQFSDEGLEQLAEDIEKKSIEEAKKVLLQTGDGKAGAVYDKVVNLVADTKTTALKGYEAGKQVYDLIKKQGKKSADNKEITKGADMLQSPCIDNVSIE